MKVEYKVTNTFIQFETPRSSSLEEFLQPRSAFSCPASRMVSLEEDPREATEFIIDDDSLIQWPATRGPSLEEEEEAAKFTLEMNARLQNAFNLPVSAGPQVLQVPAAPPPRWASIEDDEDLPECMKTVVKEDAGPAFQWPATRGPSLDECAEAPMFLNLQAPNPAPVAQAGAGRVPQMLMPINEFVKAEPSFVEPFSSNASTTDEDQALTTPPSGLSDDEFEAPLQDKSATLKISLTDTLGLWSIGSAAHETGECKPCAFLWKDLKKPGCQNGQGCTFCHLCPPGEVKRRKKEKMFMRKVAKNLHYADQYAMGFEPHFESQFEPQYQNQYPSGCRMW